MKGSKLFKNVRLKGQKELVSILVEDGIFKKIAADIPQEKTVGCEEVDLNGQLVVPPYVDPHLHLDYVFTASLGEENGSGTLFEGIQRWSESKGNMTVEQMKERIYSGIKKEMLYGVQAIRTHIDVTDPTFTGLKAALEVRDEVKTIVCHLGNGSSVSAVLNGKCVDTSMGLTPLEGLVMGTRSGDIDPAIMEFIAKKENLDIEGVMEVLNKKSGVFGTSGGLSSDFRDLTDAMNAGDKKAKIAMDVFSYRVAKYIGSYAAAMNGVDDIVFTAGIGENDDYVRQEVCKYLGYLGVDFDFEVNTGLRGKEAELTKEGSKVKVFVIPTNEELAIARETLALVK